MKVIVAGSRTLPKSPTQRREMFDLLNCVREKINFDQIVCGCAKGADELGSLYAEVYGIPVCEMPADWDAYGKQAGFIRNEKMARYADACVVFWDGTSKGAAYMIQAAVRLRLKLFVFTLSKEE